MKAMILAAGRGERMRPLTDATPKPLLTVCGRPMIDYHLQALSSSGFQEVVINIAYLGQQIVDYCRNHNYGMQLHFSDEGPAALETGGGIRHALPLLGDGWFAVINGDIHTNYSFAHLQKLAPGLSPGLLAYLVLAPNPPHRPQGDFALESQRVSDAGDVRLTYTGIGLYRAELFDGTPDCAFPLAPLLRQAMAKQQVAGERYDGLWSDVGTPQRLADLESRLKRGKIPR